MKKIWIFWSLLVLVMSILWAQNSDQYQQDLEELKQAIKILQDRERYSRLEIEKLKQIISEKDQRAQKEIRKLRQEIKSLKQSDMLEIDPFAEDAIETKSLNKTAELTIEDEFGEIEEEENQFYMKEAKTPGTSTIGLVEEQSGKLTEGALIISGFFTLEYDDFQTEDSTIEPFFPSNSTFNNSHINLYIDAKFLTNFRFFTELRFLYQPNTEVFEIGQVSRSGEVLIERAWAEWEYRDWLRIRAGNFLVPYGIWNLEHGAPILISTYTPLVLRRQIFPERATGLQVLGTVTLNDFDVLYYAWIGNGKGSQIATQDDQNNKAIGGRLELHFPDYHQFKSTVLGVSGYTGKVQGQEYGGLEPQAFQVFAVEQDLATLEEFYLSGLSFIGEPLDEYQDNALGVDLRFRFYNFFFQGEFIMNFVKPTGAIVVDIDGGNPDVSIKPSPFKEFGGYMQYAYEFDINTWGLIGILTPFIRIGFVEANDDIKREIGTFTIFSGGLNWKANPNVVLKAELHDVRFRDVHSRDFTFFTSSINVSF